MKKINYATIKRKNFGVTTIRAVSRSKRNKQKKQNSGNVHMNLTKSNVASLADILDDIIEVENAKYQEFEYNHNPTLGSMYEALTEHVVGRMLPPRLDLKMVGGFIYDDKGFRSGEIDRMLVQGEGKRFGFTDKFEYHVKDVLVVFEVKKTLNKDDLIDAYHQLKGISMAYSEYFEEYLDSGKKVNIDYAARSFSQITGRPKPSKYSDIHAMSKEDAMIFYTLVQDTYSPIKIIHGYGGYKTESGLRKAFLDFLSEQQGSSGFGVPNMPNLITSENYSLAKTTGMPFKVSRFSDGFWPVVCSSRDNILNLIIEVIWTKISIFYNVAMPWGDEFESDIMVNLLMGKFIEDKKSQRSGWQYFSLELKEKELEGVERTAPWEPVIINDVMHSVLIQVGCLGFLNSNSDYFKELCETAGLATDKLVHQLIDTNLFTSDMSENLEFVWPFTAVADLGCGRYAVSHERDKLEHWCERNSVDCVLSSFIKV
ncbi:hypothetical protein PXQ17_000438 [Vibrio parahaemolyticus]|nr:hypothetical protein [Vibrio parahaemolyticus]